MPILRRSRKLRSGKRAAIRVL
ncbi:hypothetical protein CKAH01_14301 [Colletotrichum kahawae]|uniref:Uncharacterized protein n=1 Tax=Colletotrichum kahawae TaxID=34407 RepID=A0AAD9YNG7_COLKA|nr:hypothetical protein CKAH01_14301 [Colletotrichum kahawae]